MSEEKDEVVVGFAWWRRDQWDRLRDISEDGESLSETYDEWLASAQQMLAATATVLGSERVDVDVESLLAWCNERGLLVNGKTRAQYVSEVLRSRDTGLDE